MHPTTREKKWLNTKKVDVCLCNDCNYTKYSVNDRWFKTFMLIYFYWANQRFGFFILYFLLLPFELNQINFKSYATHLQSCFVFKLQEIRASDTIGRKIITIIQKNITKKPMRNNMLIHPEIAIYFISADLLLLSNNVFVANNEMNTNQKWQKRKSARTQNTSKKKNTSKKEKKNLFDTASIFGNQLLITSELK